MMKRIAKSRIAAFIKSTNIIAYAAAFAALVYGYNANTTALHESNARVVQLAAEANARDMAFKERDERLQYGLCGLQQFLATPPSQASQSSSVLRDVITKLTGPESINCTPDPNDGH